jgi:hypothetical protein
MIHARPFQRSRFFLLKTLAQGGVSQVPTGTQTGLILL